MNDMDIVYTEEAILDSVSQMKISSQDEVELPVMVEESPLPLVMASSIESSIKPKEVEDAPGIFFFPSVCIQRYNKVRDTLKQLLAQSDDPSHITLLEYGCAELRLHPYLKSLDERIRRLIYVDKDEYLLDSMKQRIRPLTYEYIKQRETPLKVEVYSGCVTTCDLRILQVEPPIYAVLGIEIIEHLDPEILRKFERTVFGLLNPPVVILTTPNSDFNIVFKLEPGTFRHWDHRFEWSRTEFQDWCVGICSKYPGYAFEISGIGPGTQDTSEFGCVSQMAVFQKKVQAPKVDYVPFNDIIIPDCYKLLACEDYPFFLDPTPRDEQIRRGFRCHIATYVLDLASVQDYRMEEKSEVAVPVEAYLYISGMPRNIENIEEVRSALMKEYNVQQNLETGNWEIILKVPEEDEDDRYSSEEEMESEFASTEWSDLLKTDANTALADWDECW